jgi:hypothetical protein
MKALPIIALGVAVSAAAAIRNDDGSVLLSPADVEQTIQYIREVQAMAIISQQRVEELEAENKLLKQAKCS